ncbi:hypothetical protein FRB94_008168 [Tulasnella sp. JGI-2019a]|nr:hypothetical protein FRB94_008168 [Tulasnella sp. JGI-2019a]
MAALAMRFLSSATSSASASFSTSTTASKAGPPTKQPPTKQSSTSTSTTTAPPAAASRTSELPGVICKMCGTSVPMDKLGEHDCESKPAKEGPPTRKPSGSATKAGGASRSNSKTTKPSPPPPPPASTSTSRGRSRSPPLPASSKSTPSRANSNTMSKGGPPEPSRSNSKGSAPSSQNPRLRPSMDQGPSTVPNDRRLSPLPQGPNTSQQLPIHPQQDPGPGRRPSHESQQMQNPDQPPSRGPSRNGSKSPGPGMQQRRPSQIVAPPGSGPPPRTTPSPGPSTYRGPPPSSFNTNAMPPAQIPQRGPSPFGQPPPPSQRGPSPSPYQQSVPLPDQVTAPFPAGRRPSLSNSETPFSVAANAPTAAPHHGPRSGTGAQATLSMAIPDTKVGGEAGMAGVGRRGFAAVAQAALFTQHISPHSAGPWDGGRSPSPGVWGVGMQRTLSPGLMPIVDPRAPSMGAYPPGRAPSPANGMGGGAQQTYFDPRDMGPGMGGPGQIIRGPSDPAYQQPPSGQGPPPPPGGRPSLDAQGRRSPGPSMSSGGLDRPSGEGRRPSQDQGVRRPSEDGRKSIERSRSQSQGAGDRARRPSEEILPPLPSSRRPSQDSNGGAAPRGQVMSRKGSADSTATSLASRPSQRDTSSRNDSSNGPNRPRNVSDASSTYTTLSIADTGRKPVNNRPEILTGGLIARKGSVDSSEASPTSPLSPTKSVKLPFFEKLKAGMNGKTRTSTPSSGSSGSSATLAKKTSQSSVRSSHSGTGSASSAASVRRRLENSKQTQPPSMPSVKEKRESIEADDESDTELAYASFADPEPVAPPPPPVAPLNLKGKGASNSIPFPPSPSPIPPPTRKDSSASSSSGSTALTSSSSYSAGATGEAGSSRDRHQNGSASRVGVKIVAASEMGGDDHQHKEPEIPITAPLRTRGELLTTTDLRRSDDLDVPPSPVSTPSPTTTDFTTATSKVSKTKRQVRQCRKCLKMIPRGKWVYVDMGTPEAGVMCDRDWKDSYLPKCRRCDLPIEGHVISATDGQLMGKYHRACFSCLTCSKAFQDKTFYCHDGSPYCRHHYAEATGSLCANKSCGQPIEGPCALDSDGQKYHPEHFVCDWAPPPSSSSSNIPMNRRQRCQERLEEYWEVGKGRYCSERHAMWAQEELFRKEEEERRRRGPGSTMAAASLSSKATKRRTLFVEQLVDKVAL